MPPPASSPSWTQSFLDKLMGRGQDEQNNSFLLDEMKKRPTADPNQPRMRASTQQEKNLDFLNQWELPLAGGLGDFLNENLVDPLDALGPVGKVIGKAGAVVPRRLWDKRIAKLVDRMRSQIPHLSDIPRAEKFVSDAAGFLDLHKPMAAHTGSINLHSGPAYERIFSDTASKGHYAGGGNRWSLKDPSKAPTRIDPVTGQPDVSHLKPEDFNRDRLRVLEQLKHTMGNVRKAQRTGQPTAALTGNMTDDQIESLLDRILDNEIHLKENPDWNEPLSRLFTLRHEMTHGAQDLGKSKAYDESGLKWILGGDTSATDSTYWLDPVEIGARASEYKAPFDAIRIMGRGDAITPEVWNRGVDTSGRYMRSLRTGINNALAAVPPGETGFDFLTELRKGYIPELNKQFLDPSHKIQAQIVSPATGRMMKESAGAVPRSTTPSSENWNWGDEGKYSLILDQFGRPVRK